MAIKLVVKFFIIFLVIILVGMSGDDVTCARLFMKRRTIAGLVMALFYKFFGRLLLNLDLFLFKFVLWRGLFNLKQFDLWWPLRPQCVHTGFWGCLFFVVDVDGLLVVVVG